jgi:proteasome-associated ATPase
VGETEYKIRKIFERAKLRAGFHTPVVLFFDEMESMFRKRGSGKSSDVETTIVPQFLSMMDGVEEFSHIIIIGATNRPDMLDPAVMRPGRLDIKIKIDRPTREEAKDIFKKYLLKEFSISKEGETGTIPLAEKELVGKTLQGAVDNLTEHALEIIFDTNNFLEVSSSKGRVETFPLKNFVSGAVIKSVISRASKSAVKEIIGKERTDEGLTITDIETAVKEEFVQNRDHLVENIPEMEGQELEITIHIGKEKPLDKWDIPKERPYPGARRQ